MPGKRLFLLLASVALLGAMPIAGCGSEEQLTPAEGVTTEDFDLTGFTGVRISDAFAADIVQASKHSVSITADDDVMEHVRVQKRGNRLEISLEDGVSVRATTLEASIAMPVLNELDLSEASTAGLSGFRVPALLDVRLTGASSVTGDFVADKASFTLSGASNLTLTGSARDVTIGASGASRLELTDFRTVTASVALSGASSAAIRVDQRIEPVTLSGASRLVYYGEASVGDVELSGASSIQRGDD